MAKLTANELRNGIVFMYKNDPWIVKKYEHIKKGRGSATIKIKIQNVKSGEIIQESFPQNVELEEADVSKAEGQFLYVDGNDAHFMNAQTYDQYDVKKTVLGKALDFLPEGEKVDLVLFDEKLVAIKPKKVVVLKVTNAEPAVKGNTSGGATKRVTLETGASVDVPLFIKKGNKIKVNTAKGSYVSRAES